ncbi:unnamed protein product [Clonostachys chloroleuca]|uniref:MOSC domain-containing protein n=1 Tax=Clonostachys chloroleuca TaxID=1926264 RepID=A0AA35PZJ4_9HYPO|nr:unnamed protein product [Clonostachys chloroleuca]
MKISQLYFYPVKSLREVAVSTAEIHKHGFAYDRRFMLLKVEPDETSPSGHKLQNMQIPHYPQLSRFLIDATLPEEEDSDHGEFTIRWSNPGSDEVRSVTIPLSPDVDRLEMMEINMHDSVTKAYDMDVSSRLADQDMDMTKFRPSIVVSGAEKTYEEDFWHEIQIGDIKIVLAQNCGRCKSINVDYETGAPGKGEVGMIMARTSKDRPVDKGNKWHPVFGRYGFLAPGNPGLGKRLAIGDEVILSSEVQSVHREARGCEVFEERSKFMAQHSSSLRFGGCGKGSYHSKLDFPK